MDIKKLADTIGVTTYCEDNGDAAYIEASDNQHPIVRVVSANWRRKAPSGVIRMKLSGPLLTSLVLTYRPLGPNATVQDSLNRHEGVGKFILTQYRARLRYRLLSYLRAFFGLSCGLSDQV
jgi:hypothetical protein